MKIQQRVMIFGALYVFFAACSNKPQWTPEERLNIEHFLNCEKADNVAARLANSGMGFSAMSSDEVAELLQLKKKALTEAQAVRDDVLAKAHPDLPQHFRLEYQRSLELQIRNLEVGDVSAEIEGSNLHDKWVDWINSHNEEIRIPK